MTTDGVRARTNGQDTLDERVAALGHLLTESERRVAQFFADHRDEAAFLSATEIGARLQTSTATVTRAAQSLGYAGLPELKKELVEVLRSQVTPALRLGRSLAQVGEDPREALGFTLAVHEESLAGMRRGISPEAFGRAVELVAGAQRTIACAIGPSAPFGEYLAARLRRLGRTATSIASAGFLLADALLDLRPGDVVVLTAFGRVYREVEILLGRTTSLQLPVVLITDTLSLALRDRVSVALAAPSGRMGFMSAAATPMVLLDALLLGVAASDRPRSMLALDELNRLRAEIVGDWSEPDGTVSRRTAHE